MKGQWESNINAWFPFMYSHKWNCAASLFPKQNYNVLSPNSYTHISVRDLYISRIGLSILLQPKMWTDPGNTYISHRHMNVVIGTEATQFPEMEYINGIFIAVWFSFHRAWQCFGWNIWHQGSEIDSYQTSNNIYFYQFAIDRSKLSIRHWNHGLVTIEYCL